MQNLMQKLVLMLIVGAVAMGGLTRPALAIKQFNDEFKKLYKVDKESVEKSDFEKAVLEAKCFVCHQGKKKKNRNAYGMELSKLLHKKKDAKNPEKIIEALEKVAKLHTDAKDEKSPTYGDLIKAGKLPGGSLEDAKKDAKKEPADGSDKKGSSGKK